VILDAELIEIKAGIVDRAYLCLMWKPSTTAPFDRDLELAVIDASGEHALVCWSSPAVAHLTGPFVAAGRLGSKRDRPPCPIMDMSLALGTFHGRRRHRRHADGQIGPERPHLVDEHGIVITGASLVDAPLCRAHPRASRRHSVRRLHLEQVADLQLPAFVPAS
jgi:hypothetical protein